MFWTIILVLLALWLLKLVASYTMGGFLNVLVALAMTVVLYRFLQGRRGSIL